MAQKLQEQTQMKLHRNSQKRIYVDGGLYFITTNTHRGYPYFNNPILCDLFVEELMLCQRLKGFEIYGYKVNPDHIHLLMQPNKKHDFSNIMHFLKRNFSQNANKIMGHIIKRRQCALSPFNDSSSPFFGFNATMEKYEKQFVNKNAAARKFKWQKSFHFHIIVDRSDFYNHLQYIQNQWIKHNLSENKYCYVGRQG